MAYTVSKLTTRALQLANITPKGTGTPTASETEDALELLNMLLSGKALDVSLVPYFKNYPLTVSAGEESYFIPNLIYLETATYEMAPNVRIPITIEGRIDYFGTARVTNLQTPLIGCRPELTRGGTQLYFYPLPAQNYPVSLWGKFGLTQVALTDDLLALYDLFYVRYLIYLVGAELCIDYSDEVPTRISQRLAEFEENLRDLSPPDLSVQKDSTFDEGQTVNWAFVNLSGGWEP